MPKVSFIVAVYNSMPYLTQCLDSLLAQTVKDIEVICVNDCSPDNSAEVISDYIKKDARVKLINHSTNKRQGGAWNSGVQAAGGDYLCFVDADDWLEIDYTEVLFNEAKGADFYCPAWIFKGNEKRENINKDRLISCGNDVMLYKLLYGSFFISCFIKRQFLIDNDFKFIENNMYQDLFINTLIIKTQSIIVFNQVGYHYRTDNTSIQRSMNQYGFWGRLEVAEKMYEVCKKTPESVKYKEALDFRFYILYYRNSLIKAFYDFTELPWDIIERIKKTTQITIPYIKGNKYYFKRLEDIPLLQRLPIFLFEYFPRGLVSFFHKVYLLIRKITYK